MKKSLLIAAFVFISIACFSQNIECRKNYFGGHFSYGKVNFSSSKFNFLSDENYSGKYYYSLAFDYAHTISKNTEFITGLIATAVKMDLISKDYWVNHTYQYDDSFFILSIPVGVRYYFGKYFYANAGVSINIHPTKGYTWGLGGFAGIGAEYTLKSGLTFSINPQIKENILFSKNSSSDNVPSIPSSIFDEKLLQIGFDIGIGYRF